MPERETVVIGVASASGAGDAGCAQGPTVLRRRGLLGEWTGHGVTWAPLITPPTPAEAPDRLEQVARVARELAWRVESTLRQGAFPLVVGGDHAIAIGTWSGVQAALEPGKRLGLIWVDAHLDSHTFHTTPSRNIHGMPLAALLGYGDAALTRVVGPWPKVYGHDVCIIGARSFEPEEITLLHNLGVRIYLMPEIRSRGADVVFAEAVDRVSRHTAGFGISFDVDVFDPMEECGTGTPVSGGLWKHEVLAALAPFRAAPGLLALEVVEYNPGRDHGGNTGRAIRELCATLLPANGTWTSVAA